MKEERVGELVERDGFVVPGENLGAPPSKFCVGTACHFKSYRDLAAALYGSTKKGAKCGANGCLRPTG
jgi:hypothetical protein